MISAIQMKRCDRKGCQIFAVTLRDVDEEIITKDLLQEHPIL